MNTSLLVAVVLSTSVLVAGCVETRPVGPPVYPVYPLPPPVDRPAPLPPEDVRRNDPLPEIPNEPRRNDPRVQPAPPARASCDASAARSVIGREPSRGAIEEALGLSGAREARVVPFGGAATMDFNPSRLTIDLDRRGRIDRLACT